MKDLTHYIIVRRDLPLGVLAAMVTHAAGESAWEYDGDESGRFEGARAVVLEARNEDDLDRIEDMLYEAHLQYVVVVENSGPYVGQLMAIGLVPISRERGDVVLNKLQTIKTCATCILDNQAGVGVSSGNPNETV